MIIEIPTRDEYWGNDVTPEQAQRAADALEEVVELAAEKLGLDVEIIQCDMPSRFNDDDETDPLSDFIDWAWQCDEVQAYAFDDVDFSPISVLRNYDIHCRRMGGHGLFSRG